MGYLFCTKCKRDMTVRMVGVGIIYAPHHVYPGDLIQCIGCDYEVVLNIGNPIHDREYRKMKLYLIDAKCSVDPWHRNLRGKIYNGPMYPHGKGDQKTLFEKGEKNAEIDDG